jgi:chromosome condensin MukBEF MukE localization factor
MTLGTDLERDRLAQRARRIRAAVAELRRHAEGQLADADTRKRRILQAIAEFEAEVAALDRRLADLANEATLGRESSDL